MKRNKTKTNTASFLIRYVQQYRLIVSAAKYYLLRIAAYVHMYVIKTAKGFGHASLSTKQVYLVDSAAVC